MAVNLSAGRIDVRNAGIAAVLRWVDAQVAAETQDHLIHKGERLSTEDRSELKAMLVYHRTNLPLPRRVGPGHWQALSSDGVTVYEMHGDYATSEWTCSCPAHGACWHRPLRRLADLCPPAADEHLPFDAFQRPPMPTDEMPVQGPRGKSKLFLDEVA